MGDEPKRSRFKAFPIGYFQIDIAQVSTQEDKLHLFVAIAQKKKARISILGNGSSEGRIRLCRLLRPRIQSHLRMGRAIRLAGTEALTKLTRHQSISPAACRRSSNP
jgi:hypothetical protein